MPICAKEEASGSPAKSSAARAIVESFIFIFRCSIELKRETRWAAKYSNETLPELHGRPSQHYVIGSKGRMRVFAGQSSGVSVVTPPSSAFELLDLRQQIR